MEVTAQKKNNVIKKNSMRKDGFEINGDRNLSSVFALLQVLQINN